jgi:hypothetical protein
MAPASTHIQKRRPRPGDDKRSYLRSTGGAEIVFCYHLIVSKPCGCQFKNFSHQFPYRFGELLYISDRLFPASPGPPDETFAPHLTFSSSEGHLPIFGIATHPIWHQFAAHFCLLMYFLYPPAYHNTTLVPPSVYSRLHAITEIRTNTQSACRCPRLCRSPHTWALSPMISCVPWLTVSLCRVCSSWCDAAGGTIRYPTAAQLQPR